MANSTFSGPVRSQNGFQEWNGTAWVPVAGGGGGGMPVVVLTENNAYGTFSGGVTGGAVNLPKLEVGQSLRVVGDAASAWASKNFVWKVVPYVSPNSDFAYIEPNVSATKLPDPYYMQMQSFTNSLPFPPDTLYVYRENLNDPNSFALQWITFEITYLGPVSGEGLTGDVYQFGNIPFFAYYGINDGQSVVDWYTDPLAA